RAAGPELPFAWCGYAFARRHGARDRAHGEFGPSRSEGFRRQVDCRHRRWQFERPLRALRSSDEEWAADFDAVSKLLAVSSWLLARAQDLRREGLGDGLRVEGSS